MNTNVKQTRNSLNKQISQNPYLISKALAFNSSHTVLFKKEKGFSFLVFWNESEAVKPEPIATAIKTFKTRAECITAIKKLTDAFPSSYLTNLCYDYNLKKVDVKIQMDVTRHF